MLLMVREIDANPPTNIPRWIYVKTGQDTIRALAFVAARQGVAYAGKLPLESVALRIGEGGGPLGISGALPFPYRFDASPARH